VLLALGCAGLLGTLAAQLVVRVLGLGTGLLICDGVFLAGCCFRLGWLRLSCGCVAVGGMGAEGAAAEKLGAASGRCCWLVLASLLIVLVDPGEVVLVMGLLPRLLPGGVERCPLESTSTRLKWSRRKLRIRLLVPLLVWTPGDPSKFSLQFARILLDPTSSYLMRQKFAGRLPCLRIAGQR